jgi:hypothetical protein
MANGAANVPVLVPEDQTVYRALVLQGWIKRGRVTYRAFMLRPATEEYPPEEEISVGLSPESATAGLNAPTHGFASLMVADISALNRGLTVRVNVQDAQKAELWGLPLFDVETRDIAIAIATDLAEISAFIPPTGATADP